MQDSVGEQKREEKARPMYESVNNLAENDYNDFTELPQDLADYINENGGKQKVFALHAI